MDFKRSASAAVLTATLFLMPLYTVYAEDSSKSANPRLQAIQNRQQNLENLQSKFESQLAQMKDRIASREAEFKLRLDKFKDQAKAQIAERINHNLNLINQNQTTAMNKNLDLFSDILDRVVTHAGGTASSSAQVVAARSAIDTARNAVTLQAGKDYTINVSTESAIQKDAQAQRDKLHTDLQATRQVVIAAKQAVATAIHSLLNPSPSPSASGSATLKSTVKESSATGLPVAQ